MKKELLARMAGEFLVIVVGVLVALAVDDWRQYRQHRELERDLLNRLEAELVADAADLATARREIGARLWVLDAILAGLGDVSAAERLNPTRLDSLTRPVVVDSLRAAAGRGPTWTFDPVEEPLGRAFMLWPEFDLSDDAYQEMLATGSLGIVRNSQVRSAIMRYYRVAEDQGANERKAGEYQDWFENALGSIGSLPVTHWIFPSSSTAPSGTRPSRSRYGAPKTGFARNSFTYATSTSRGRTSKPYSTCGPRSLANEGVKLTRVGGALRPRQLGAAYAQGVRRTYSPSAESNRKRSQNPRGERMRRGAC